MRVISGLFLACSFSLGCTFYTDCPTANTGGATGSGGTTAAGNGGTQPSGGSGGTGDTGGTGASIPTGEWVNATGTLAGMDSDCGTLSYLSSKPDEDMLIAGVALQGLWASRDGGDTWDALSPNSPVQNRASSIVYDPEHSQVFWESGIYEKAGIYRTDDDGKTLKHLDDTVHNEVVSVDFTDPQRQTLVAGGHEQQKTLSLSQDGGKHWSSIGASLPDDAKVSSFPYVLDAQTFLLGAAGYGEGIAGIFLTTNAGKSWARVSTIGGDLAPLPASDGSIYWSSEGDSGIAKSSDGGLSWDAIVGPNTVFTCNIVELPDGRIVTSGLKYLLISADGGTTWVPVTSQLPYRPYGVVYSVARRAFFIWHGSCNTGAFVVPADGVLRYDFDYELE